ncbi:MAG: ATP-binding protein [Nanoarchaeota archaeon]
MYIEREINKNFRKIADAYSVIALVGARQAGKTTFLKEHAKGLKSSYLSFDDPDIRNLFEQDIKKFERQYLENSEVYVLDEVQYCKEAGRNLKYLADKGKKMWITSSSELILGKEVLSFLVGRVSVLKLYPLSLNEFLKAKNQKEFAKQMLQRNIWEHITYGGYPKVVITEDIELKKTILRDLNTTMILKDIANTFSIENIGSLEEFSKYLALNIGNLISYEEVSNNLKLSFQTVKKYLDAMEKSYLILKIAPFYRNKIKEITKQPKIYFVDTGLRNLITKNFDSELDGKLFENYVASELIKAGFALNHWRTKSKAEVDFVIEKDKKLIPIEVKINSSDKIERSLQSFIEVYKPKKAFVVSYKGEDKTKEFKGCKIFFTDVLNLIEMLEKSI